MKTLAVVQARMGSSRLPGKVMKILGNKRAIGWAVSAAMRAPGIDMVVVATSTNPENDILEGWCHQNGVRCYRGSENDVLDRYCGLIRAFDPVDIVRLTGDCPFVDSHVIGDVIALHQGTNSVYTTNQWPPTWPDGLDVEVVSAKATLEAGEEATSPIDRETVTQFIWRNQSRWPATNLTCPINLTQERWVLDSPEDYELLKKIVGNFPEDWIPCWQDIWNFLNEHPEHRGINRQWARNQRFYEALTNDATPKTFTKTGKALVRASIVIPNASQTFSKSCLSIPEDGCPLFASHGDGAYIFDVDGNRYVDLVGALLPNILGYNDPDVNYAIRRQLDKGISFSLATELEAQLAETLIKLIPCAEMVRFGKNGSDATSGAMRLARAWTGRDRIGIIQWPGGEGYHGWHDWAIANSPRDTGIPGIVKSLTHRMEPNIEEITEKLCRHKYAAILIDPENHNYTFLSNLKALAHETGALFVFDEIRTGFRYALGGYQEYIGVVPDLACFGKALGNGMPISAIVGRYDLMSFMGNKGGPFWSGTFFGETLSIAAAIATIAKIERENVIDHLWKIGQELRLGTAQLPARDDGIKFYAPTAARMQIQFANKSVQDNFIRKMANEGILILNSHNTCYAMGENELDIILSAYRKVLG